MGDHAAYWTALAERGTAILFGPVGDPNGVWGLGVLAVEDEKEVQFITSHDPVMRSGIGAIYEILPMLKVVIGSKPE